MEKFSGVAKSYVSAHGLGGQWDADNPGAFGHEAGHLLILGDTHGGPQDIVETRRSVRSPSAAPTAANIANVIGSNPGNYVEW